MKKPAAKKALGRPRIADETVTLNIRLSVEQRQKVDDNGGGPWVRKLIERAKGSPAGKNLDTAARSVPSGALRRWA